MGSTFATTVDTVDWKPGEGKGKRQRGKTPQEKDDKSSSNGTDKQDGIAKKKPKCFSCGGDHYINQCPEFLEIKKIKEEEKPAAVTWDVMTFVTYLVNAIGATGFKPTEVLLDNQANISIMRPDLLSAFKEAKTEVKINGVGGVQLSTRETGYLPDFFRVCTSSNTKANILSFAKVEDLYEITYQPQESFTVHLPDRDIVFHRRDKLYVTGFSETVVAVTKA
jgi:hypothetical protein